MRDSQPNSVALGSPTNLTLLVIGELNMLLYHGARPNPRAVRMFLAEKQLVIPIRDMDVDGGENRRPEFVIRNPAGQVPVLELDDGSWIAETGKGFEMYKTRMLTGLAGMCARTSSLDGGRHAMVECSVVGA